MGPDAVEKNQNPRAVLYFADDNKVSTGELDFSIDLLLEDSTDLNELTFLYEVYAWNDGEIAPRLSWGGATPNDPSYNVTNLGDAVAVLEPGMVRASDIESGQWGTVPLGRVDVGDGYDNYAFRFGILGATEGDDYGLDNVSVTRAGSSVGAGLEISDVSLRADGQVTLTIISPGGSVDVYRSTDLNFSGAPIAEGVPAGEFLDPNPPSGKAFYVLVPTGGGTGVVCGGEDSFAFSSWFWMLLINLLC